MFPRHNVFQPKGYIFLGFHPLTLPLHFNWFCFILSLQILHNLLDNRLPPTGGGSVWGGGVCGGGGGGVGGGGGGGVGVGGGGVMWVWVWSEVR